MNDKLAISSLAVEEWYKEYLNYSRVTSDWNGNILHDEQIAHFLQVCENFKYKGLSFWFNKIKCLSLKLNKNALEKK